MLNIAICDDEPIYLKKIKNIIKKYLDVRHIECEISCFESGEQLIEQSKEKLEYDMVFLDVNMKEMDGVETAQIIRMLSDNVYIIFITAYITYATAGYKVNAIRYLLKNDKNLEISLKECIDTIIDKMHYTEEWIEFEFQNGKRKLPTDRILYVESQLHKLMFFILENGIKEYYMYDKMDKIERILNNKGFYRIHQSFLVNMKYVKMIERYKAVLIEGSEISISKKYYKSAEREYLKMKGEI